MGSGFRVSGTKFEFRAEILGFWHKISSFGRQILGFEYKISSFGWQCRGGGYPEVLLVVTPLDYPHGIRVVGFGFREEFFEIGVQNIKFRVENCGFRVQNIKLWLDFGYVFGVSGEIASFGYRSSGTLRSSSSSRHLILRVSLVACCPSRMPRGPPPCSTRKCGLASLFLRCYLS